MIQAYLHKDKSVSAADLVKYKYDSSVALSSQEEEPDLQSSHHSVSTSKAPREQVINLVALSKSKNIPI